MTVSQKRLAIGAGGMLNELVRRIDDPYRYSTDPRGSGIVAAEEKEATVAVVPELHYMRRVRWGRASDQ